MYASITILEGEAGIREKMLKGEVGNFYREQVGKSWLVLAGEQAIEHYEVVLEEEARPPLEDLDVWEIEP
jgi:hypothetical protein